MYRILYRKTIAAINFVKIFFRSLAFWPPGTWFRFWFTFPAEQIVPLGILTATIRTSSPTAKVVDLYMAVSCIVDQQYLPADFLVHESDTVIDIGAHIGSFTLLAAQRAARGRVLSYEPDPSNYSQLVKNINVNGQRNVTPIQMAVSAEKKILPFQKDTINSAESSLYKKGSETIAVPSTTLNDIFLDNKIEHCDFLKIDCEGAEYEILFSAPKELFSKIEKIVMECHTPQFFGIENPAYSYDSMIALLKNLGYKTRIIHENAMHNLIFAKR